MGAAAGIVTFIGAVGRKLGRERVTAETAECGRGRRRSDILALNHFSNIFEHCNNPALHCLSVRFVGVASPPVQCSNAGLKMRNKKCWVVAKSKENSSDVL